MRVLCGELGYRPAEVYDLLYCEACIILAGHRARLDREIEQARWGRAWLASFTALSHRLEKWPRPHELLGEEDPDPARREEERLKQERAALEILGIKPETPENVLARFGVTGGESG